MIRNPMPKDAGARRSRAYTAATMFTFVLLVANHMRAGVRMELRLILDPERDPPGALEVSPAPFPFGKDVAVTCSWDDGSNAQWDLRMATLLAEHGWKGTFYWTMNSPALAKAMEIRDLGMEIATHTATHPFLTSLSRGKVFWQVVAGKIFLEALIDRPVLTIGYPFCKRDGEVDAQVLQAALLTGRQCGGRRGGGFYHVDAMDERLRQPAKGLSRGDGLETCLERLRDEPERGLIFAFWGHVREPEFYGEKWERLEEIFKHYGHMPHVWYATHGEIASWMHVRHAMRISARRVRRGEWVLRVAADDLPEDLLPVPAAVEIAGVPAEAIQAIRWQGGGLDWHVGTGGRIRVDVPVSHPPGPEKIGCFFLNPAQRKLQEALAIYGLVGDDAKAALDGGLRVEPGTGRRAKVIFSFRNKGSTPCTKVNVSFTTTSGVRVHGDPESCPGVLAPGEDGTRSWMIDAEDFGYGPFHALVVKIGYVFDHDRYRDYYVMNFEFDADERETRSLAHQIRVLGPVSPTMDLLNPRQDDFSSRWQPAAGLQWRFPEPVKGYLRRDLLFFGWLKQYRRDPSIQKDGETVVYAETALVLDRDAVILPAIKMYSVNRVEVWMHGRKVWDLSKQGTEGPAPVPLAKGAHVVAFRMTVSTRFKPYARVGISFDLKGLDGSRPPFSWRMPVKDENALSVAR